MPGRVADSLCDRCFMQTETISHKFIHCSHSSQSWAFLRELIEKVQPLCIFESDHSILNLYFSPFLNDNSILWLLGEYLDYIENVSVFKKSVSTPHELRLHLKLRWQYCIHKHMPSVGIIPGLEPSGIG